MGRMKVFLKYLILFILTYLLVQLATNYFFPVDTEKNEEYNINNVIQNKV